eukprot:TRINITY_DN8803_c0_g1_i2.p1 TRINITY_DN8803_c0_g1~~TRINITY_DN8803_c0_g1_i2.p1  ORF type:complete len:471 (-),score=57.84 TRINITY_DN8803_c0_g1_i2:782-2194(-)
MDTSHLSTKLIVAGVGVTLMSVIGYLTQRHSKVLLHKKVGVTVVDMDTRRSAQRGSLEIPKLSLDDRVSAMNEALLNQRFDDAFNEALLLLGSARQSRNHDKGFIAICLIKVYQTMLKLSQHNESPLVRDPAPILKEAIDLLENSIETAPERMHLPLLYTDIIPHLLEEDIELADLYASNQISYYESTDANRNEFAQALKLSASIKKMLKLYEDAKRLYIRSLDMFIETEGYCTIEGTEVLIRYSDLLLHTGETEECINSLLMFKKGLDKQLNLDLGINPRKVNINSVLILTKLSSVFTDLQEYKLAEEVLVRCVELAKTIKIEHHTLSDLASLYFLQNNEILARKILDKLILMTDRVMPLTKSKYLITNNIHLEKINDTTQCCVAEFIPRNNLFSETQKLQLGHILIIKIYPYANDDLAISKEFLVTENGMIKVTLNLPLSDSRWYEIRVDVYYQSNLLDSHYQLYEST